MRLFAAVRFNVRVARSAMGLGTKCSVESKPDAMQAPITPAGRPNRMSMRYGIVILPETRWPLAAQQWRRAEELGFDHAWTFDHLMWRWLRESTWFSALPTLTAAATVTSKLRLGTLVSSPNLHHPVSLAKHIMTVDDISGGRLTFGIRSGRAGFRRRGVRPRAGLAPARG